MGIVDYIIESGKYGAYNHYQLRLKKLNRERPDIQISVLKFSGTEALSQIPRYEIEFTSATADIPANLLINYSAELLMYPDGKPFQKLTPRIIPGIITQFRQCNTSADETRYVAVLEHKMARMAQGRNSAVFLNDSIISMTENTFGNHLIDKLGFAFKLNTQYPLHDFFIQYQESDYTHVARRLADAGVTFYRQYDEESNEDVIVLTDHSRGWISGPTIPYRHPAGLFDGGQESVWDMQVNRSAIPKQVGVNDDNYRDAQSDMKAAVTTSEEYRALRASDNRWAEHYPEAGKAYQEQPGQGIWYADIRKQRHLSRLITFEGKSNCMALRPGMIITTPGKVWPDAPDGLLVVSTSCKNIARDSAYFITFNAIPWSANTTWRPEELPWPTVSGNLPARVSSTDENDIYSHIDEQGRYRIRFDLDQGEWQKGFESCWVRLAKPYAGGEYGFHWPLLDGTGVMVGFESGDIDRPFIAHVMHDSRHEDHVTQQNHKRNILLTPAKNTLLMDDWREHEFIKLSTPHSGLSELNLGHLVDKQQNLRGEGSELRTDAHLAVRGAKGVLLTSEASPKAEGQQLDMAATIKQLEKALALAKTLEQTAQTADASPVSTSTQQALATALHTLKEPGVVMHGEAGIAQTTPQSLQQTAGENLIATAGQDASFSVFRQFSVAAGQMVSLFAHKLGLKLIAAAGRVQIQAQKDQMELTSFADMQISSTNGRIVLNAKEELLLMCGGAGIRIKNGVIEELGPTRIVQKTPNLVYQGGESVNQAMPSFNKGEFVRRYILHADGDPEQVLKNQAFRIHRKDGSVLEGVTDELGQSPLLTMNELEKVALEIIRK
ncbi:type VI secretion system Vgr family protein [Serratia sp. DD3]|uniref:type VI secretion system Vgr family protein n=1 Tax=Serratia sp. DD3 TaxID=1410619 RepID=UPI0003C4EA77|nr:type VI secretion system Vgr family protein [Serratia sp. DD3]KEY56974.1 Rhs element Vgr protein [Serratia sp. DD3]